MATEAVQKWLVFAKANHKDAQILFRGKSYQGAILSCHQALEKYLKAVAVSRGLRVQKSHDLPSLLKATGLIAPDNIVTFLAELNAYYNPARYPDAMPGPPLLFTRKTAAVFLKLTKITILWTKNQAYL